MLHKQSEIYCNGDDFHVNFYLVFQFNGACLGGKFFSVFWWFMGGSGLFYFGYWS